MRVKTDHTERDKLAWDLKKAWESKQTTHKETSWVGPEEGMGVKIDHTKRQAGWDLKKAWESKQTTHRERQAGVGPEESMGVKTDHTQRDKLGGT